MNSLVFICACVAAAIIALVVTIRYRSEKKEQEQKERFEQYYNDPIRELVAATEDASVEDYPHQGDVLPSGRKCPSDEYLYNITREQLESFSYADFAWLYNRVWRNWYSEESDRERQDKWCYILTLLNEAFENLR